MSVAWLRYSPHQPSHIEGTDARNRTRVATGQCMVFKREEALLGSGTKGDGPLVSVAGIDCRHDGSALVPSDRYGAVLGLML